MLRRWKNLFSFLAMLSMVTLLVAGCPMAGGGGGDNGNDDNGNSDNGNDDNGNDDNGNGGDENPSPVADAGADQEVTGNTVVNLEGTATDQNSDVLTFAWVQTEGTEVELTGEDSAAPSFTAPNVDETLTFELTVSDGNTSDTDEVNVVVTPTSAFLFVINNATFEITSYDVASGLNGPELPATLLNPGAATSVFQPRALVVTPDGRIFIGRQNGGIVGFNDAFTANLDTPADFVIEGTASRTESPIALAYDAANDRLFVGNAPATSGILVFDNISDLVADASGAVDLAPTRMFSPPDRSPFDTTTMVVDALYLDHLGNLYVSDTSGLNGNSSRILVFNDLDNANEMVTPSRTITSAAWMNIEDLVVDSSDVLYVIDGREFVFMFEEASQENGAMLTPENTLTVQRNIVALEGIAVDENGVGYLADQSNHKVYTYGDMGTLDATLPPDATLEGNETELFGPRKMFLFVP